MAVRGGGTWNVLGIALMAALALAAAQTQTGTAAAQGSAAQQPTEACRAALAGTWLTTIRNQQGGFASRSLLTLHGDGSTMVVDSRQHSGVQGASFSAQLGAWRCDGAMGASATTLNFGFPPRETVARSDWRMARSEAGAGAGAGATLAGVIVLRIKEGVEGVDPFAASFRDAPPVASFRFEAVRVDAPAN